MSSRGNEESAGYHFPPPLFLNLLQRAFVHFADASPTVLRTKVNDQSHSWVEFPSWNTLEANSISELSEAVTEQLSNGPVLLLPSWERLKVRRDAAIRNVHELVLASCRPAGPDSLLATVIPAQTMISRGSEQFRQILAPHWRPVLVQYGPPDALHGVDLRIRAATVFLRAHTDGDIPPLRMFEYSHQDDDESVLDDFSRLLARKDGCGKFGYVLRNPPDPGKGLGFARHDPKLQARRDALAGFGGAAALGEMFVSIHGCL